MGLVGGGVGLVVFGIIVLGAGFFMNSYTQDNVSQCVEWYGQLGQMLDLRAVKMYQWCKRHHRLLSSSVLF
jgi:hypothetical protein